MFLFGFLTSKDRVAYFICSLLGLCVFFALRPMHWANYVGILVAYHLFVGWLVTSAEKKDGRSLNIPTTIAYHVVCVALLIGSRVGIGELIHSIVATRPRAADAVIALIEVRFIVLVQVLITYGLAYLERDWIVGGGRKKEASEQLPAVRAVAAPIAVKFDGPLAQATGADHEEWLRSRSTQTVFYKPGTSPRDDFEQWLRARGKTQYSSYAAGQKSAAS